MNDLEPGDDLPIIDVRSPAERIGESGRAGFERLQQRFRASHLDIAALAWMLFLLGVIALQVYSAARGTALPGFESGWEKATIIAQTGSLVFSFGAVIGIALAFSYTTAAARAAIWMALVTGAWIVIANVVGIAVAFHDEPNGSGFLTFTRGTEDKVVQALISVMEAGFALVVIVVACNLLFSSRARVEPEVAEVS